MKSILIIDDDPLIRKTLSTHLSTEGYEIHTAMTGEEGLAKYDECFPDLVLLDVRLPDMRGLPAAEWKVISGKPGLLRDGGIYGAGDARTATAALSTRLARQIMPSAVASTTSEVISEPVQPLSQVPFPSCIVSKLVPTCSPMRS